MNLYEARRVDEAERLLRNVAEVAAYAAMSITDQNGAVDHPNVHPDVEAFISAAIALIDPERYAEMRRSTLA